MNRREILGGGLALSASALSSSLPVLAQGKYPDRPIKLIVPFSAGGVVDAVGRQFAERIRPHLGTIVVENLGGAGGTIGMGETARAKPDGYTLGLGNTSTMIINPTIMPKVPYDPAKDFAPISILAVSASGIIVHPSVPAKTLKEFIAYAKANQEKMSYGSAGAGTMTHLAGELFKHLTKTPKIVHVPYKGAGPSINDLVGGAVQYGTINITGQLLQLHDSGKVRILAVASEDRLKGAPKIPTAVEAGLPNMIATLFTGLVAPAGTPKPILDQVYQATQKVMQDPAMQKALIEQGLEPIVGSSPDKMRAFLKEEKERWGPVLEAAGLKK
ncbi:MAG: tripartite tricarboxylate transporter substrate binding protein [Rhizobiales bacterium]|nr:tripartite tricarboxylate transporter substrate binding protein [Hyphomicrobiales bacterium]